MGDLFSLFWYIAEVTRTGVWDKVNPYFLDLPLDIRYHVEVVGEWIAHLMGWG